jgi:putrescine---pyruvate transaminase
MNGMATDHELPGLLHPFARPGAPRDAFVDIVAGNGAEVSDADGNVYVDALGSLWYCNIGHGRAEIAEAIATQMGRLEVFHTFDRFTNPPADALADRLVELAPMPDSRVFLTSGGSESVETAIKLARIAQGHAGHAERTVVVSRRPSYHGVTYGAMSATGLPGNQEGFGPLLPDVVQVPYDDVEALDRLAAAVDRRIAAVIAEPVIGAGGVYPPPRGYLAALRERCDRWDAFLVFDEVICGFGRLGAWWAAEHFGVVPDMITFAKGVTSGYLPLGGVLVGPAVRAPLESDPDFVLKHGYTYSGHPLPAVAAMANLDIIEKEGLLDRAAGIAERLGRGLADLVDGEHVVEVRGTMGIWALRLAPHLEAAALRNTLLGFGVIARPIGNELLAFCPPLVISGAQMDRCVEGTRRAIHATASTSGTEATSQG